MRIAFYASSLLSAYWNGAATYYRGIVRGLSQNGHTVTFYEPDAFDRQKHRDLEPPEWCRVVVYPATREGLGRVAAQAADADIVIKASGVGYADEELLDAVMTKARRDAVRIFWDVDAPATLAEIQQSPAHPLRLALASIDAVLTYGGGDPVVVAYTQLGATNCVPVYNALDPSTHHPVAPDPRFSADLAFLGNRLPDREQRVEEFLLRPASLLPGRHFILGGSGWTDKLVPPNIRLTGHVATAAHNAFNATPLAVLNVNRASMASNGFSPPTRVFEAAGAGACLITDAWEGIELFLTPREEVLVARDGKDVAEALEALTPETAKAIGQAARARLLAEHTYEQRARDVDRILRALAAAKRREIAA
jgi:spore maturation protein CgeB